MKALSVSFSHCNLIEVTLTWACMHISCSVKRLCNECSLSPVRPTAFPIVQCECGSIAPIKVPQFLQSLRWFLRHTGPTAGV